LIEKIIVLCIARAGLIGLRLNFVEDVLSWVGWAVPNFRGIGGEKSEVMLEVNPRENVL